MQCVSPMQDVTSHLQLGEQHGQLARAVHDKPAAHGHRARRKPRCTVTGCDA